MTKELLNEELIKTARADGRLGAEKPLDQKRKGGEIHGWRLAPWGDGGLVVRGSVTKDDYWGHEPTLRTSLVVSIDRETGVLETLNTVYTLVGEEYKP